MWLSSKTDRAFARFCRTGDPDALALVFDRTAVRLLRVAVQAGDYQLRIRLFEELTPVKQPRRLAQKEPGTRRSVARESCRRAWSPTPPG